MTFQPYVPTGGLGGWRFLQATLPTQKAAFEAGGAIRADMAYFRDRIADIQTPQDLVSDFRLLKVALGAFGLSDEIGSPYLIRKVLEEGTLDPGALANRLSDKRYRDLSKAFGFGDFAVPNTVMSDFPDSIERRYMDREFEIAVGRTDEAMRLALNARRELPALAAGTGSDLAKWYTLMGTPSLRTVLEGALGLPQSFAALPIDKQLAIFRDRSEAAFGTSEVGKLGSGETVGRLIDRFAVRAGFETRSAITSPALQILRGY